MSKIRMAGGDAKSGMQAEVGAAKIEEAEDRGKIKTFLFGEEKVTQKEGDYWEDKYSKWSYYIVYTMLILSLFGLWKTVEIIWFIIQLVA